MEQTAAPRTGLAHIEPRFNALAQACHSSAASAPQLTYTSSLQSIDHSDVRRSFWHVDRLVELDINPVIVRPSGLGAVAVDALIRLVKEH
jgi:hypothetical protein